ncbi:MAG: helix-turn-helix transcriptional regulator [Alphaproteobacteria bacterium]|nr:helix-turn-helix transcriptional regulator [Alphaproteobacteria bacterium]
MSGAGVVTGVLATHETYGEVGAVARMVFESDIMSLAIALITEAELSLETNRATSKACLARAHALLSVRGDSNDAAPGSPEHGGLAPWQKQRLKTYIELHMRFRIDMSDLTSIARLSTSHFARAFKKSFGAAPFAYIARTRVERAKRLMLETDLALSQIALECGMCDQSHFTRVFSRLVGQSPNRWRRAHSSGEVFRTVPMVSSPERQQAAEYI